MSSEQPPPLPPPPPPPSAPPVAAQPVDPYAYGYPYPAPMSHLAFTMVRPARPGLITAIGVLSIVVASLSVIGVLWTAGSLIWFSTITSYAGALAGGVPGGPFGPGGPVVGQGPTTAPAAVVDSARTVVVESGGLDSSARAAVAQGLSELQFITSQRLEQLDVLLAKSGQDMFPSLGASPSAGAAGSAVLAHGTGLNADPGSAGPDYFRTRAGRFELYDDRAVFYPTRGEIVRVSTLTTSNPGLNPTQVQAVVQQAQATSGNTLNASQSAALTNLLSAQGPQLVSPITVPTAVRGVTPMGDGSVMIQFPNGFATIGPQGQTSSMAGAAAAAAGLPMRRVRLNGAAMALAWFATLVGGALAVYLFVIGILVLRQSPRGRKLHLAYALLKIPVAILGAAAVWWVALTYTEALVATGGPASPLGPMSGSVADTIATQQLIFGVLYLIYPIALRILLQTRAVKEYYETALV